jgi:hypothetical protein
MKSFKGLLYIKHGRVGTRSEGPDYYLQTKNEDFLLQYQDRNTWDPDYHLEFYCRTMAEISGDIIEDIDGLRIIQVENIKHLGAELIPE